MKKVFLILVLLVFVFGCFNPPEPPKELPEDFEVEYKSGAMHLEWGHFELKIDSAGKAIFTKTMETAMTKKYEFDVSETERKKIYDAVVVNGFFNLNDKYQDPMVMDGGWNEITIKANGESKTVTVLNYTQDQFDKVENEIGRLIRAKIGEKAFDFTDFLNECPEKELECKGIESAECWDWKHYCGWKEIITGPEKFTLEYCDKLENRKDCIEFCSNNQCTEKLCDLLMFDAKECTECSVGCCSYCNDLDSCEKNDCIIAWIHPSGESWQYAGCQNKNLCETKEEYCNYLSNSYQGYGFHSTIEKEPEKAFEYIEKSSVLQELYSIECIGKQIPK